MGVYCLNLTGQDLVGAWEWTEVENDREVKTSVIITDKYQVATWYLSVMITLVFTSR